MRGGGDLELQGLAVAEPVTDIQAEELDRRLAAFERDGDFGQPWPEVSAELLARSRNGPVSASRPNR